MRIMNVKRAIIILLIIGIMVVVSGCVRGGIEPGETEYQLEITVEVAGEINSNDGIYYIVLDADEESIDGPGEDIEGWEEDFYYIKLDSMGFWFAQVKDDLESIFYGESNIEGNILQVTVDLSDLGDPESGININVVTTDLDGNTTYNYLDDYFNISTVLYSTEEGFSSNGLEEDEADFDIINVTAEITTLY